MKLRHLLAFLVILILFATAAVSWFVVMQALSPTSRRVQIRQTLALTPPDPDSGAQAPTASKAAQEEKKSRSDKETGPKVTHEPRQPKTGQPVLITVPLNGRAEASGPLTLEYQVVEPGQYIALKEAKFEKQWTALRLNDQGEKGDKVKGDGIYSVQLPGDLQKHRRLIRYRIRAEGKPVAPPAGDPQPNFAYFVYDGVPPWKGAINPKARESSLRQAVTYSSEALQKVPVYHFISSKAAVERTMWTQPANFGGDERHAYPYTGTLVYDGVVYDHVGFRARGGGWRHAMGKNMWKINFLPGHRFEARDHYGRPYPSKWDKLNLGACIQQGDYGMRGEQGMFEAVGFRLFNLAGTEAPDTHWIHLRVINQADESPADQYSGDFWGLYLAVENIDEHFLKEHDLPPGNVYKMDFGPKTAFNGDPRATNQEDINEFVRLSMRRQQPADWWVANVDLPRYYNYRSILECIHHYDIDSGKNYFYYRNPKSAKWVTLPWDIDLSWGERMFGGGAEPFYRAGLLAKNPFKHQYQERLAEIRDLLFNADQIGQLIDEYAAMISDPRGGPSLADADRAKWDYHPILASAYVLEMKAGQGKFYFGDPRNTFPTMVKYMKTYAARRAKWIDTRLLAGYSPPPAPEIIPPEAPDGKATVLPLKPAPSPTPFAAYQWRLAEITRPDSPSFNPREPWKYEIQTLWSNEFKAPDAASLPMNRLAAGRTYRLRVRGQNESGIWSRWSSPVEIAVPAGVR